MLDHMNKDCKRYMDARWYIGTVHRTNLACLNRFRHSRSSTTSDRISHDTWMRDGTERMQKTNLGVLTNIEFDHSDVVRHPLVSKIIQAYQKNFDDKN